MKWLVSHQGWYFFPILMLEGLSMHSEGFRRVVKRGAVERRWVEFGLLVVRLGGFVALAFLVLSPGKAVAFIAIELAVFGFYLGSSFAPNHIGMPLVSPRLKLDFLRRQVLMSRNISGGRFMSILMGGLNYQIEHHLFPSMARPYLRKVQPLVAAYCAAEGVPYTQTTLCSRTASLSAISIAWDCAEETPSSARSLRNVARCNRGSARRGRTVLTKESARAVLVLLHQQPGLGHLGRSSNRRDERNRARPGYPGVTVFKVLP